MPAFGQHKTIELKHLDSAELGVLHLAVFTLFDFALFTKCKIHYMRSETGSTFKFLHQQCTCESMFLCCSNWVL